MVRTAIVGLAFCVAASASAQTTRCTDYGDEVRCTTDTTPALDYGALLKAGRDLVPEYRVPEQMPRPPEKERFDPSLHWQVIRTGNDLYKACANETPICAAYVSGVSAGLNGAHAITEGRRAFCPPESVTLTQLSDVVEAFLEDKPEIRHMDAGSITAFALASAFPCK